MAPGGGRDFFAAGHPRDFFDAIFFAELGDGRADSARLLTFLDPKMRVGKRSDLGKMRNAQDLMVRGQFVENLADPLGRPATDARVHFVEDQDHAPAFTPEPILDCQKHPRQLSTRRDLLQRCRGFVGIG